MLTGRPETGNNGDAIAMQSTESPSEPKNSSHTTSPLNPNGSEQSRLEVKDLRDWIRLKSSKRWPIAIFIIVLIVTIISLLIVVAVLATKRPRPTNSQVPIYQPESTTAITVDYMTHTSRDNLLLLANFTLCDDASTCISMSETHNESDYRNKLINVTYFSSDRNISINYTITPQTVQDSRVVGKIKLKVVDNEAGKSSQNISGEETSQQEDSGCQPRKTYISWENVRSYLVHNRIVSIPGTWIGEPLEVLRCRDFLDPCRDYGSYCGVSVEQRNETLMEINIGAQKVANLSLHFVQDSKCQCATTKPIVDDIETPPYIYNASVVRLS